MYTVEIKKDEKDTEDGFNRINFYEKNSRCNVKGFNRYDLAVNNK